MAPKVRESAARNDGVEFLELPSPDRVERAMAQASFLVVPSTCDEGLPKTIVEASSVGTTVLASRRPETSQPLPVSAGKER